MQIIIDADLIIEGILNRPKVSPQAVEVWKKIEMIFQSTSKSHEIHITNIGLARVKQLINIFLQK